MRYLDLDEVLALHGMQIARFGGGVGIRDVGLLESALAMPRAEFAGIEMRETVFEKAAAYLYRLVRHRPFVNGNKRTTLMS